MSFDVFLQRFAPVGEEFDERAALAELLRAIHDLQCESITATMGEHEGKAEIEIDLPLGNGYLGPKGAALFLRTLHPEIMRLIHALAVVGDMVIIPAMEPARFILVREEQRQHLPQDLDWEEPVVCAAPDDLGALLLGGFDEWAAYRDHVLRDAEGMPSTDGGPEG